MSAMLDEHPSEEDLNPTSQPAKRRFRRIAAAGLSALCIRGAGLLVSAVTVPLTVRYLGVESYGLWITISSTITMFLVLDIGVSSTLTNLISEAYAKDNRQSAAAYFATAFWILVGISSILGFIGWFAWPYVHWAALFHVQDPSLAQDTSSAVAAAFIVFLVSLPTSLASKVLSGYQELHYANFFSVGGILLSLFVVLSVVHFHGSLPLLVAGFAGSSVLANVACLLWTCLISKPWLKPWPQLLDMTLAGKIFHSGFHFFVLQMAGLIVFSSDNLIISHYLSPAQVTPYAITWRLVNYIAMLQTFIFPSLWPAYAEAYAVGHLDWIRSTYARVRKTTLLVLAGGCGAVVLFGQSFIRLWAGSAAVPTMPLVWAMCAWIIIYAITTNQSCLMAATNRIGKQAFFGVLAAVVNLLLSLLWIHMGTIGVILATIVSYLVFIVYVQTMEVRKILRGDFLYVAAPAEAVQP